MQGFDRGLHAALVDMVVPIGNEIAQRATGIAEGNAAVHATGSLGLQVLLNHGKLELLEVLRALRNGEFARVLTSVF